MNELPEFSRLVRLDSLSESAREMEFEANEAERQALARRFDLVAIDRLFGKASVRRRGDGASAKGALNAAVTQSCVVTGEPVEARIEEPFDISFRPPPVAGAPEEEVELDEAEMDVIFFEGGEVDLGEALAQTLSLSLDPYPRAAGAEIALREAGVKSEEEAGPFGALAALRDQLKP